MRLSQNSLKFLIPLIAASAIILSASVVTAQQPVVYFSEKTINEDSKRENGYIFIGNVCASYEGILDPKVLLISDLETKTLQLVNVFYSDECFGAVEKIRAIDPDSIHTKLVSFGDNSQVERMKAEIQDLRKQVEKEQILLTETKAKSFDSHQDSIDAVNQVADQLWLTRKNLQHTIAQFYELMSYLHPDLVDQDLLAYKALECPEEGMRVSFNEKGNAYCSPKP